MSRVGKKPINVPAGVKVTVLDGTISVEGAKGKLKMSMNPRIKLEQKDSVVTLTSAANAKEDSAIHGLMRSLINNMVIGVTKGYAKELEITGVGYKAQVNGKALVLQLGFSHPVNFKIPNGVTIAVPKPTSINISGMDKQLVGEVAATIRNFYKPEPYKGKGIKYAGEQIRRKAGKAAATGGGTGAGGGK
ncbi:MAG: 50S ribosomal protein L6 [Candidatus Omnitrophica bacterium CG1_02_49_10]|nr:MAG: 50S ribosomal protein L6 [Candidatus Omnitrophica bacterium CG1_02_49_10]